MDARWQRSRSKLTTAVLALASTQSADNLTASSIAAHAGVHRSTFYEHATSPMDLLQSALSEELDAIRARYLDNAGPDDAMTAVTNATVDVLIHADRHAAIYRAGLKLSLHSMLSEHFQESTRVLLRHGAIQIPGDADAPGVAASVARFFADGTVGIIAVWLDGSEPRDPLAPLRLLGNLTPSWWPVGVEPVR